MMVGIVGISTIHNARNLKFAAQTKLREESINDLPDITKKNLDQGKTVKLPKTLGLRPSHQNTVSGAPSTLDLFRLDYTEGIATKFPSFSKLTPAQAGASQVLNAKRREVYLSKVGPTEIAITTGPHVALAKFDAQLFKLSQLLPKKDENFALGKNYQQPKIPYLLPIASLVEPGIYQNQNSDFYETNGEKFIKREGHPGHTGGKLQPIKLDITL